jgi:hypothetical protein
MPDLFERSGIAIDDVFRSTAVGARAVSGEHLSAMEARFGNIRGILKRYVGDSAEAERLALKAFTESKDGSIIHEQNVIEDLFHLKEKGAIKEEDLNAHVQKSRERILKTLSDEGRERTAVDRIAGRAAASRIKAQASEMVGDKGIVGVLARRSSTMMEIANKEQEARKESERTGKAVSANLTMTQAGVRAGASVFADIAKNLGPAIAAGLGTASGFLIEFVNRSKQQAGLMAEITSAQGLESNVTFKDMLSGPSDLGESLLDLRMKAIGTAVSVDKMSMESLRAMRRIGGLARGEVGEFAAGLTAVAIAAPVAGISSSDAINMISKAQSVSASASMKSRDGMMSYFQAVRVSAKASNLSVSEFLEAASGIEDVANVWGTSVSSLVGAGSSLSKIMSGITDTRATRTSMIGSLMSLSAMPLTRTLALHMAAYNVSANKAAESMRSSMTENPIGANAKAFADFVKSRGLMEPGKGVQLAAMLESGTFGQFNRDFIARAFRRDANFMKLMDNAASTSTDLAGPALEEIRREIEKGDPVRRGAEIASSQLDILEQIYNTLQELPHNLARIIKEGILPGGRTSVGAIAAMRNVSNARLPSMSAGFDPS